MTGQTLALDPGPTHTGWALIADTDCRPLVFGKDPNDVLLGVISNLIVARPPITRVAIEMVASYGMPVGREVFDTCVWIGRYRQLVDVYAPDLPCDLVYRQAVRLHHCRSTKAGDPNVTRALVDRFTPGQRNFGKGTKAAPGWFHGFAGDMWQAMALAVYAVDKAKAGEPL